MGAAYSELGPLGRDLDLAIWEVHHLKSSGKSPHTVKSYIQGVRALAGFLTDQGLSLDPERITTSQLRAFQAYLLLPEDQGGAGKRTSTVCTRHDSLKLFFAFLEEEDDLPNPMRRVQRPAEEEVTIQPLTEAQLAAVAAVEVLSVQGAVSDHHVRPVDAWAAMVDDWLTHRNHGHSVLMLATERAPNSTASPAPT